MIRWIIFGFGVLCVVSTIVFLSMATKAPVRNDWERRYQPRPKCEEDNFDD